VIGARFFYEKISPSVMATADAAKTAFDQQCRKDGGSVIPEGDAAALEFRSRRCLFRRTGTLQEPASEFRFRLHH
jgi:hypothetical protein